MVFVCMHGLANTDWRFYTSETCVHCFEDLNQWHIKHGITSCGCCGVAIFGLTLPHPSLRVHNGSYFAPESQTQLTWLPHPMDQL